MLYKFKSKETADLIMLEPHARQILAIIGKAPSPQGIVLLDEMAMAIQQLQEAIHEEEVAAAHAKQMATQKAQAQEDNEGDTRLNEPPRHVSLKQRATPFMDMLKRAQAANVEVVWGA